jgi:pentatricopeptide repeat protein
MQSEGVKASTATLNALMGAVAKSRQWQQALRVCEQMRAQDCDADAGTYDALISVLAMGNQWRRALQCFRRCSPWACRRARTPTTQ